MTKHESGDALYVIRTRCQKTTRQSTPIQVVCFKESTPTPSPRLTFCRYFKIIRAGFLLHNASASSISVICDEPFFIFFCPSVHAFLFQFVASHGQLQIASLRRTSLTFFASVLMASWTIHVIPHVSMAWSKGVHTVFFSEIVWLILSPVAEFKRTAIHPSEHSFSGNIIQTNPRLVTIVPVLNIYVFFLAFNGR